MKFTIIATATGLLATTALAGQAPPPPPPPHHPPPPQHPHTVTVQLANDHSGANANAKVPTDGEPHPIEALWGHTAVSTKGVVSASSSQLTKFEQDTKCKILQKHPWVDAHLNARHTWVSLDDGKVVELEHGVIICH